MATSLEFWLFLPQMRLTMDQLSQRALNAEAAGFAGMAGMDHMAPPLAERSPMFDAMITNAWLATQTRQLRVGSLVLCDSFRHPAVLAREAVSLDHLSAGRFELGIGWGSVASELETFGIGSTEAKVRVGRLKESLEIVKALWRGETLDYDGEYFTLRGAVQQPGPLGSIPVVIGGAGRRTMELVAAHADWWNVHVGILDKLDEMRRAPGPHAARCRCRSPSCPRKTGVTRSRRWRSADSEGWALWSGRRRSSSTTSGRWPSEGSNGCMCGSPTSPHRRRFWHSARKSSARSAADLWPGDESICGVARGVTVETLRSAVHPELTVGSQREQMRQIASDGDAVAR